MIPIAYSQISMPFFYWAKVWSQLVDDKDKSMAWQALELPNTFESISEEYWSIFHIGMPVPSVSLLLHAFLGLDGANSREDWMRVANHFGLKMAEHRLTPDHLASACEIFAIAVDRNEKMLIRELSQRYLLPYCNKAESKLMTLSPSLAELPKLFREDILQLLEISQADDS